MVENALEQESDDDTQKASGNSSVTSDNSLVLPEPEVSHLENAGNTVCPGLLARRDELQTLMPREHSRQGSIYIKEARGGNLVTPHGH